MVTPFKGQKSHLNNVEQRAGGWMSPAGRGDSVPWLSPWFSPRGTSCAQSRGLCSTPELPGRCLRGETCLLSQGRDRRGLHRGFSTGSSVSLKHSPFHRAFPSLSRSSLPLCCRFPCPESRRCHFLRARSLPGHASPCPSAVLAGQGPGPWQTSRPERSRPRLRGQRPPPPPPRPGERCQGPARAGGDPRAGGETLEGPPTPQLGPAHWNWQQLEAGEVREGSFPTAQGPVPKGSRELLGILLEHSYSQGPLGLPQH